MITHLLAVGIGLVLGWNLIPQPVAVKRVYERAYLYVESKVANWIEESQR